MNYFSCAVAVCAIPAFVSACSRSEKPLKVVYKVSGLGSGKFVRIAYLDTTIPNQQQHLDLSSQMEKQLKYVRVPTSSLPWTKTVYLPPKATTFVSAENKNNRKSKLSTAVEFYRSDGSLISIGVGRVEVATKSTNSSTVPSLQVLAAG